MISTFTAPMILLFGFILGLAIGLEESLKTKVAFAVYVVGLVSLVSLMIWSGNVRNKNAEFYASFENGTYIVNTDKCFNIYDETDNETIKALISSIDKNNKEIEIQKATDNNFVVNVNGKYIVLYVDTMQQMIEEKAIKLE